MINHPKTLGKTSKLVLFLVVLFINAFVVLGVDGNVNSFSGKANPYNLTFSNYHEINLTYNWTEAYTDGPSTHKNYTYSIGNTSNLVEIINNNGFITIPYNCTQDGLRIHIRGANGVNPHFYCIVQNTEVYLTGQPNSNFYIREWLFNTTDYISILRYTYIKNLTIDYSGILTQYCYQEFFNKSTGCGGLSTGNASLNGTWSGIGNIWDGDYSTFSEIAIADAEAEAYINYTIPKNSTDAILQVKYGNSILQNLTINSSCINITRNKVQFKYVSASAPGPILNSMGYCYNDSNEWQLLFYHTGGPGGLGNHNHIYEESVIWNITQDNQNTKLYISTETNGYNPDFLYYQNLTSTKRFYANISKINQFLQENCTCSGCIASGTNCLMPFYYYVDNPYIITSTIVNATYAYGIDNCSNSMGINSNATALNVTFYDYDGNMLAIDYGSTTTYYGGSYSYLDDSLNNISLCVYPNWFNLTTETQFEYMDNTGTIYSYFFDAYLNNRTQYLNLYTQNSTTAVLFTVVDIDENPKVNYTIHVLKYNVGTGAYTTTEILKTDSQGHAIGNIVLNTAYYNFFIYDTDSNLALSETGVRLTTTSYTFTISAAEDAFYTDASNAMGINYNLYFNNETNNVVFTWSDPAGTMHLACLKVDNSTYLRKETMTDTCTESTSGTIVYNIPTLQNDTTYTATGYLKYDYPFPLKTIQFAVQSLKSFFHQDKFNSLFSAMLLILFGILLGLPNINFSMIYFIGMVIITATLGMWYLTMPLAGSLVILGIIVLLIGGKQQ